MSDFGKGVEADPGISVAFRTFGFMLLIGGVIVFGIAISDNEAGPAVTGACAAVSSIFLFGFGAVISRLHKIEYHLRPEGYQTPDREQSPRIGLI